MRVRNIHLVTFTINHARFNDEFTEVRAVKLLQHGRRLQQVE
jgi:hypothetical protein